MAIILPTVGRFSFCKKKIFRLTAAAQHRISCRNLFKQLEILPVSLHYSVDF